MKRIVRADIFRSEGRKLNQDDDMARVVVEMSRKESSRNLKFR